MRAIRALANTATRYPIFVASAAPRGASSKTSSMTWRRKPASPLCGSPRARCCSTDQACSSRRTDGAKQVISPVPLPTQLMMPSSCSHLNLHPQTSPSVYSSHRGLNSTSFDELMVDRLYDEAYPSLGEPLASFVNRYLEASETVLVLQGGPGTGKTRLVRAILSALSVRKADSARVLYTADKRALESDEIFVEFVTLARRVRHRGCGSSAARAQQRQSRPASLSGDRRRRRAGTRPQDHLHHEPRQRE